MARETEFSDGSSVIAFILLDPEDYGPAIIYKLGDTVFFEKYPQSKYSISVKDGGYSVDPDWTVKSWGAWAENLNPGEDKLFTSENDEDVKNCKYNFGSCMYNCQNRITGRYWSDKIKAVINGLECQKCKMSKGNDSDSCKECMKAVAKIPGIYERADTAACIDDCESSPSMHMCVNDLYRCETKTFFRKLPLIEGVLRVSMHGLSEFYTTAPVILKRECDPNTCSYTSMPEIVRYCLEGQKCYARDDGSYAECSVFLVCGGLGRIVPKSEYPLFIPEQDIPLDICPRLLKGFEVLNAHDPNAKHVDVTGNVMPGQTLNYTIEYENEGEGTAYDVFILDELCSELDENTLVINDAGEYSEASRLLSWEIGNVPGGGQGEVNFSVNVKDEISTETEIINFADVHFPSAFEITPTNAVVNTVKSIAADPQTVSAIAGAPVSTILTGRDGGSSSVTYDVTESPLCGTLTGTPPNLIYTSTDEFIGQDEFYFTVSNGTIKSDPAKVTINVVPNPSDTSSPEVTDTYPGTSVTNVHVGTTPVSEDPVQYTPTISASFSEPVDSETVTTDTFTVEGLTGYVYYDEQSRAAYFMPSTALSPSTTYTAKLSTGIKDKMGNPLASEYNWQFSTESPANIAVTIPDNADEVNFGDVLINTTSDGKIVSISSTGTEDLVLDSIMLTGTDPEEFRITEDNCSGGTLTQFMNCTVKVLCEPVSTGIKNANLSIPSNDTDEETVEITLSGTCVAESFWPALYGEMWGVDREKNLSTLRSLRDNVLSQSEMGREYIYAIYSNSLETAALLVNNPSLLIKTREVISGLMPEIQCLLEGNKEMSLSQDQLDAMERLLDEYITKASPNLRTEIMKVKRDINEGNIFNKLGIVINE